MQQADLLPGNLDLVILKAISLGDVHGYGICRVAGATSVPAPQSVSA